MENVLLTHCFLDAPGKSTSTICDQYSTLHIPYHIIDKTDDDMEREARLVEQWVGLTEERNAVLVPAPDSGIPGAPANW